MWVDSVSGRFGRLHNRQITIISCYLILSILFHGFLLHSGQLSERGCIPATSGQVDVVRHLSIPLAAVFHVTVPPLVWSTQTYTLAEFHHTPLLSLPGSPCDHCYSLKDMRIFHPKPHPSSWEYSQVHNLSAFSFSQNCILGPLCITYC